MFTAAINSLNHMINRLGVLASHPIQYQAPLFRELARHVNLTVYFAHRQTTAGQAAAGFNVAFEWDVDLLSGYEHRFLRNRAIHPSTDHYAGCDTPEIAEQIRQGGFDAFLVTGWYLKSYWQAIRACRRQGVPVMVRGDSQLGTPRSWLKQSFKELIYPRILSQFDAFLYVGKKNKEYLKHYGVAAERLFFAPHCIDNDAFARGAMEINRAASRERLGIKPSQLAVLFVGKLLDIKRPYDLVDSLQLLRSQGVDSIGVFVGDGPLRCKLENQGRERNVPLIFQGFRNQTELPESYVAADVLVLPSGSETWGLVVNEALASGTPVVVSDAVGCAPDLVTEGETGAVYPVGDIAMLADALKRTLVIKRQSPQIFRKADNYSIHKAAQGILDAAASLAD